MSFSSPKYNIKNPNTTTRMRRKNKKDEKLLAINACKKLYQKYYEYPSSSLLKQLEESHLKIYIDKLTFNDISIICELLTKYLYFQQIEIFSSDPNKDDHVPKRKIYRPISLSKEQKNKMLKEKMLKEQSIRNMTNKLIISLSKNLSISTSIILLSLNNIGLTQKSCEILAKAISSNKSIKSISITNSSLMLNSYELLSIYFD